MANTITLDGFFGVKQAFHVSDPDVTTGWERGQLFIVTGSGTSGTGTLKGAAPSKGLFVGLADTSGSSIAGMALDSSADNATTVAGMQHPSGSKVTVLHGHSSFFIRYAGTVTVNSGARVADGAPWEIELEDAGAIMDLLYTSANGKFATFVGGSQREGIATSAPPTAIGHLTQVPSAANSFTMGVVLYG